jgi:ABC-type sugar transport system substrate-binding protein
MSARLRATALVAAAVLPLAAAAAGPAAAQESDDQGKPYTVALVGDDNDNPLADQPGGLDNSVTRPTS